MSDTLTLTCLMPGGTVLGAVSLNSLPREVDDEGRPRYLYDASRALPVIELPFNVPVRVDRSRCAFYDLAEMVDRNELEVSESP